MPAGGQGVALLVGGTWAQGPVAVTRGGVGSPPEWSPDCQRASDAALNETVTSGSALAGALAGTVVMEDIPVFNANQFWQGSIYPGLGVFFIPGYSTCQDAGELGAKAAVVKPVQQAHIGGGEADAIQMMDAIQILDGVKKMIPAAVIGMGVGVDNDQRQIGQRPHECL